MKPDDTYRTLKERAELDDRSVEAEIPAISEGR